MKGKTNLSAIEVNPLRGFIRPASRVSWIKAGHDIEAHSSLGTLAAKLQSGWADEASAGTHLDRYQGMTWGERRN
jgi:hypothetical protein